MNSVKEPMPQKQQVRFGIVGCGRIAPRHGHSIRDLPGARLIAVADCVTSRAHHFATQFRAPGDPEIAALDDYRRLLDHPDVDVVTICTPSGLHAQMAVDAMAAGKHVLVEKPIALTLEDADRMIAAAETFGRRLSVVLQNRYNPPMQALRRAIDENRLGRVLLGNATVRWYRPQEYYEDGWHGTWAMDGGAFMNQSIHHIDALQWLIGEVDSVFAFTGTLAHRMETEDTGVGVIRFRNGALGSVEGSTITYPENLEASVALFGERGSVKVGGTALNRRVFWKIDGELEHEREMLMREQVDPPSVYGHSHATVVAEMAEAVREERDPATHGREGRRSVATVLAFYESARTGRPVTLAGSVAAAKEDGLHV